ncbi:hypothetical protein MMPV_005934 [Pyropia vietnamensis]
MAASTVVPRRAGRKRVHGDLFPDGEDPDVFSGRHLAGTPTARCRMGYGGGNAGAAAAGPVSMGAVGGTVNGRAGVPFSHGNITSLKMHNFLTFNDVALSPGPRLNLIIGPNGSGKSTVVNALCIVFNGHLRLLGRSTDLSQYIRHGQETAWVEASLYDTSGPRPRTRTVRRTFHLDSKSEWQIDGVRANKTAVEKLRGEYDIQLDNLCQFLPQERIAQFTELRPAELLSSTMAALGGTAMTATHKALIDDYAELASNDQSGLSDAKALENLEAQNAAIQLEVTSYAEREQLRRNIADLEAYRPWVLYDDNRREAKAIQATRKAAQESLDEAKKKLAVAEAPIEAFRRELVARGKKELAAKRAVAAVDRTADRLMPQVEDLTDQVRAQVAVRAQLDERGALLERKVVKTRDIMERAARAAEAARPIPELQALVQDAMARRQQVRSASIALSATVSECQRRRAEAVVVRDEVVRRLAALADVRKLALARLCQERGNQDVGFCWEWIQKNRHRFEEPVLGPIGIELSVENQYHGRILEASVPGWMRGTFVTQTAADNRLLLEELKRKLRKTISTINVTPQTGPFHPNRSIDSLRMFGFTHWASEIYQAPDPVRRALQSQVSLHHFAVGTDATERNADVVREQSGLSRFYTPSQWYSVIGSRFDPTARTTRISKLHPGRNLYSASMDDEGQTAALRADLERRQEEIAAADARLADLDRQSRALDLQVHSATLEVNKAKTTLTAEAALHNTADMERRRYEAAVAARDADDVEGERLRSYAESGRLRAKLLQCAVEEVTVVSLMAERLREVDQLMAEVTDLGLQLELAVIGNAALKEEVKRLEGIEARLGKEFDAKVLEVRRLKQEAVRGLPDPQVVRVQLGLAELPETIDALEEQIATLQTQVDLIAGTSRHVVDEFERRQKRIAALRLRVESSAAQTHARRHALDTRREAFVANLKTAVDRMSIRFSELYTQLGCSGELNLVRTDDLNEMYVEILVRYREATDLRALSGQTHSGGERMVATMLYHFALQEQTPAPFRVVDEMNQGMDAHFERAILSMMIRDARREGSPQCLLITPKLLLDLEFNSHAVTHMIFNGEVSAQV